MNKNHWILAWVRRVILPSVLAFSGIGFALAGQESTIFTFDGHDFIRAQTTLVTEDGKSAVNTKLDHNNPGYKALIKKHSYTGEVILFGEKM